MSARHFILFAIAVAVYLPALKLPFIGDDYHQAQTMLDRIFGLQPMPLYAANIVMHALCVLALYAICTCWKAFPRTAALWAALFFAIEEAHHDTVLRIAAASSLLAFALGSAALAAWIQWLNTRRPVWYAASLIAFVAAAATRDTFWVFALLMLALTLLRKQRYRGLLPFLGITLAYLAYFGTSISINHTIAGIAPYAIAAILITNLGKPHRADLLIMGFASLWIALGFLASETMYLATGGLAVLVGLAFYRLSQRAPKSVFAAVFVVIAALNLEILWVKRFAQARELAEPTELLKYAALQAAGPITVTCAPISDSAVDGVLRTLDSKAIHKKDPICRPDWFTISYTDRAGGVVGVSRRIGKPHGTFY